MLNPQSPLPLYHQLADILIEKISSEELKPGQVIPSETALCRQYGIGRPTVRQSVDILVKKGLVERKRGSGTFVKPPVKEVDLFSLAGTSSAFLTSGISTETRILEKIRLIRVPEDTDNPFSNVKAYFLSRLTIAEMHPVLLEEFYLEPELFSGIDAVDLENTSLSRIVKEQYFLIPEDGRQTFRIVTVEEKTAGHLGISSSDPVLEVKRVLNFSTAKKAIFSRLLCRTDTFAFSQTISGRAREAGK